MERRANETGDRLRIGISLLKDSVGAYVYTLGPEEAVVGGNGRFFFYLNELEI